MVHTPPAPIEIQASTDNQEQNNVLMVALYLVLLAFFILLNSLAFTDQQRSEEAIQSVSSTFRTQEDGVVLLTKAPKSLSMEIVIKRHYDDLQRLAQDYIEAEELNMVQRGRALIITFPSTALFQPDRSLIKDDKRAFLKHVAASVYPGIPSTKIAVSITGTSRQYLSDRVDDESMLEVLRVGALARYISINRVPESQIFTGMTQNKSNIITLRFEIVNDPSQTQGGQP